MVRTECGDLRAAEPDLREGLELSERTGWPLIVHALVWLAGCLVERGALEEAEEVLARTGLGEQVPESAHFIGFLEARGKLRLAQHKPDDALRDFLALRQIAGALDIVNPAYGAWRSSAAAALHALGRGEEATQLAAEELELARRWGVARQTGIALRFLGRIGGGVEGEQRLREAVDLLASSPARLEHAAALVDLGALLRRRNERSEARQLLREGVELAHRCGATPLVERANEELAATGARPRKILLSGLESLTASERRVAQLAAEALSNREIAQALFVTVKTVEVHLSSVYRKLEISSRRQLAAALVEPRAGEPVSAVG